MTTQSKIESFMVKVSHVKEGKYCNEYFTECYFYADITHFLSLMEGMGKQTVNQLFDPSIIFAVECAIRTQYFDNISTAYLDSPIAWEKCASYEEHSKEIGGVKYNVSLYTELNLGFK